VHARRLPSIVVAVLLAILVAWSFGQRYAELTESPFPVGIDGYFYPIQLRSLLETGALAYPASPLTFWLMLPFAAATDPITGAKLGAALFGALVAVPAYGVGARLGHSRGAGLVAAALATTSAGSSFLTFEFVKNGIGLTIALGALWLVLRALDAPSGRRIALALAGVVAALLAHKMAGAIVVALAAPGTICELVGRGVLRGRRLLYLVAALAGAVLLVLVLGLLAPERFVSPRDLGLVLGALGGEARWTAPALALPPHDLMMGHEALLGGGLALLAAASLARPVARALGRRGPGPLPTRSGGERAIAWGIVALALAIALPWLDVSDPQGIGFRLRIVAFIPMSLCAAIAAPLVCAPLARWASRRSEDPSRQKLVVDGALATVALLVVLAMPTERTEGKIEAHPLMVDAVMGVEGKIPEGGVAIVPERHIAFMVRWYARVPVMLRPERIPPARRWRVMPLAFIGMGSPLDRALLDARREPSLVPPIGLHSKHPNGLVIVSERTWEWLLARLPPRARAHFERWPTI